jgi:hypothetical protein
MMFSAYQARAATVAEEYSVKAALSLNFARFTEWPQTTIDSKTVNLCVLGNNLIHQAFEQIDNKDVGKKHAKVIYLTRISDLEECHLLFVSGVNKQKLIQLVSEISRSPILTIGEDVDFLENGGMIFLELTSGKVSIKINLNGVKNAGLQISSRVLKLATIVNP